MRYRPKVVLVVDPKDGWVLYPSHHTSHLLPEVSTGVGPRVLNMSTMECNVSLKHLD